MPNTLHEFLGFERHVLQENIVLCGEKYHSFRKAIVHAERGAFLVLLAEALFG